MKLLLEIDLNNDAFAYEPLAEVKRAINAAIDRLVYVPGAAAAVFDLNGNKVGAVRLYEDDDILDEPAVAASASVAGLELGDPDEEK